MSSEKILVIEGQKTLANGIAREIEKAGYSVVQADSTLAGMQVLGEVHPHLIIFVNNSPLFEARHSLIQLRKAFKVPILVIGERKDVNAMLEIGADAYLDTPSSMTELLARVRSILRRQSNSLLGGKQKQGLGITC